MARRGAYKSEKRKKEVMRQKKQEMKRQKRTGKDSQAAPEKTPPITGEVSEETPKASEGPEEGREDAPE